MIIVKRDKKPQLFGCTKPSRIRDTPNCGAYYNAFLFKLKRSLLIIDAYAFYDHIYSAAQELERCYNAGWRMLGGHYFGEYTKELSKFRHFMFTTVSRGRYGSIDKDELREIRKGFREAYKKYSNLDFGNKPKGKTQ